MLFNRAGVKNIFRCYCEWIPFYLMIVKRVTLPKFVENVHWKNDGVNANWSMNEILCLLSKLCLLTVDLLLLFFKVNRVLSVNIQYIREFRSFLVLINICKTKVKQNTLEIWYGMVIYGIDRFLAHSQKT